MRVAGLFCYPIKSARGHAVDRISVQAQGFEQDRAWMLVDENGRFCSQREDPKLGELAVRVEPEGLRINEELLVSDAQLAGDTLEVQVWKDTLKAQLYAQDIHAWFSERLGRSVRLVRLGTMSHRVTPEGCPVSFADGYPILVANTASLSDLQARIGDGSIEMPAFRPNLVVHSETPWAEDSWNTLRIGDVELELVSPCVRCKMTTLDPREPTRAHPQGEPLRTLATFRRAEKGVTFGWNAVLRGNPGMIAVGNAVLAQ